MKSSHVGYEQCSCFPVSVCPGGGKLDMLLLEPDCTGSSVLELAASVAGPSALLLSPELEDILGKTGTQPRRTICNPVSVCVWQVEQPQQKRFAG